MNRRRTVSGLRWAALVFSACVCVICFVAIRRFPSPRVGVEALNALVAERDRIAPNTDSVRESVRHEAAAAAGPAWTDERLAALQRQLGSHWQWTIEPAASGTERRATVRAVALELSRWPACVAAVEMIERQPGIVVERIDFAAEGAGSARRFVRVVLTLRLLRPRARTPRNKERAAALSARSLFRGRRRRPGGEPSRVSFCAPPAVRLRLPTGLHSGGNARPFLLGPDTSEAA